MTSRVISCIIGYCFGCFLTAELVARHYAGKGAAELGETGNPGMANIMASLGFKPGILTLLGDVGKTVLAMVLSWLIFQKEGWIVALYAGLGATIGHNYPFWRGFRGGKGVATSSAAIILFNPLWGLLANIAGMLVTFATKYLCIAGPVIPLFFMLFMFLKGEKEAGYISIVLSLMSLISHGPSVLGIFKGTTSQTDVIGALRRKLSKKK